MSKVAIEGNASGTGTLTIAAPNTNSNFTLTIPDATGTIDRLNRDGNVLQVVQGSTATAVTSSTDTFVDTGLSASITPTSSSSKILVLVSQNGLSKSAANSTNCIDINLLRGATSLLSPTAIGAILETGTAVLLNGAASIMHLDSPATTSSTTYKTQFRSRNNNASVAVQFSNISNSTITLMEIAG